jgi:transcriptional regulator with XRE-family HTH domain
LSTLYRIESGQASPTVDLLTKLAIALGVEVVDFFPPKKHRREAGRRR